MNIFVLLATLFFVAGVFTGSGHWMEVVGFMVGYLIGCFCLWVLEKTNG